MRKPITISFFRCGNRIVWKYLGKDEKIVSDIKSKLARRKQVEMFLKKLLEEKSQLKKIEALDEFYGSKTYSLLAKEETKMWHYSPLTLYTIWKSEKETGEPLFPEE